MGKTATYAFRCRTCGHLEEAGQAGERQVPASCRYCGSGVSFDPKTGVKRYDEDNWVVLADLPDKDLKPILKFHGITEADIGRHKPFAPPPGEPREPQSIERAVDDGIGAEDKVE